MRVFFPIVEWVMVKFFGYEAHWPISRPEDRFLVAPGDPRHSRNWPGSQSQGYDQE